MSHLPASVFVASSSQTITNTTTETSAFSAGFGSKNLYSDWFKVGNTLRVTGYGVYSTPAVVGGTVTIRVKLGSTTIASVATSALLVGASSAAFHFEVMITIRAIGVSGSVVCGGAVDYEVASAGRLFDNIDNDGIATTVDTTGSPDLDITAQWDTQAVTKIITVTVATVEMLQ